MAPTNGTAKSRRSGGSRQAASNKPVVPAIPLPYMKRQAAAAAASASAPAPAAVAAAAPPASTPKQATRAARVDKKLPNGAAKLNTAHDAAAASETADPQPASGPETNNGAAQTAQRDSSVTSTSELDHSSSAGDPDDVTKASTNSDHPDQPTVEHKTDDIRAPSSASELPVDAFEPQNDVATGGQADAPPVNQSHSKLRKIARPPPSVSPSRYQMPPSFQPANRPRIAVNGDMSRAPRPPMPNGPPMHHPHPSNGSIHFGNFHGSASSSPAPPLSGGFAPPPGMTVPDGRPPYMGPGANGFPPMMPYGADMVPVGAFDNYGRPSVGYRPAESYTPYGNNFGPSNHHNFQDGQAGAHADGNGMYARHPPGLARNGMSGPTDEGQQPIHHGTGFGVPDPRMMHHNGPPARLMSPPDDADGLIGHLQQQFRSPDFADCHLELRFLDGRAPPVRIPAHRIILSRSTVLAGQVSALSGSTSSPLPTILLETQSKWIRGDSFYMAAERLYGLPLFPIPLPPNGMNQPDLVAAGSLAERFDFGLSYAAAGHLLGWDAVVRRGCEMVVPLLDWQTLERALEFALEDHSDRGSHDLYKYGDGSRILLNEVVNFIVRNLPRDFVLDTTVSPPVQYSRLPFYPSAPASATEAQTAPPAIARGTSVNLGRGRRSQQLTGIQFGDLSMSESKAAQDSAGSRQPPPVAHAILSRVLLNLPFTHLKMALESSAPGSPTHWTDEHRHRIIKEAVAERERRRLQAVDAVKSGRVPGADSIKMQLSTPEPRHFDEWSALGWQEEIVLSGNHEGFILGRIWTPLIDGQDRPMAAYP